MRTLLLITLLSMVLYLPAQDIPSEVVGDAGWVLFGPDTMIIVRAADGHVWLQQNMGAENVAAEHNDPTAFGDLYQWGRWHDGHASRTSATAPAATLAPNNPLGLGMGSGSFYIGSIPSDWWGTGSGSDTWEGSVAIAVNGIDPCTALGDAWQLPTQADWTNVLTVEAITNTLTAFASNLKLTAAGARDGQSGIVFNAGVYGQYWSTTASGVYAKDLTVGDSWVNPDDDALRGYGMSVRCLNKALHVGLGDTGAGLGLRVFPNPSAGIFTVDQGTALIERVETYASDMRPIRVWNPKTASPSLTLPDLPNGLYWIKVVCAAGIQWRTLIIER